MISNSNVCEWWFYNIVDANSILIIFGSNEITRSMGIFYIAYIWSQIGENCVYKKVIPIFYVFLLEGKICKR